MIKDNKSQTLVNSVEDEKVFQKAVQRVNDKNRLMLNIFDFCLFILFCFLMMLLGYNYDRFIVILIYVIYWGLRLTRRIGKFAKDCSIKSLGQYFEDRKDMEIKIAYQQLLEERAEQTEPEKTQPETNKVTEEKPEPEKTQPNKVTETKPETEKTEPKKAEAKKASGK